MEDVKNRDQGHAFYREMKIKLRKGFKNQ